MLAVTTQDLDYLKHFAEDPIIVATYTSLIEDEIEGIEAKMDALARRAFKDGENFSDLRTDAKSLEGRVVGLRRALAILKPENLQARKKTGGKNV